MRSRSLLIPGALGVQESRGTYLSTFLEVDDIDKKAIGNLSDGLFAGEHFVMPSHCSLKFSSSETTFEIHIYLLIVSSYNRTRQTTAYSLYMLSAKKKCDLDRSEKEKGAEDV